MIRYSPVGVRRVPDRIEACVTTPLYKLKAEFFKTLAHPARIRILELLSERERSVGELQGELSLESSHTSQQLAVLRRAGAVKSRKQGNVVLYSLAAPEIAELLTLARRVLTELLAEQTSVLAALRTDALGAQN